MGTADGSPSGGQDRVSGWLGRYSGVLGLLTVLLIAVLIGLLIGHWLTQKQAPSHQVITVKGLSTSTGAASNATSGTSVPAATSTQAGTSKAKAASPTAASAKKAPQAKSSEASEVKEVKEAETKALPKPVKADPKTLQKLSKKTGKDYEREINKLVTGDQPIEG